MIIRDFSLFNKAVKINQILSCEFRPNCIELNDWIFWISQEYLFFFIELLINGILYAKVWGIRLYFKKAPHSGNYMEFTVNYLALLIFIAFMECVLKNWGTFLELTVRRKAILQNSKNNFIRWSRLRDITWNWSDSLIFNHLFLFKRDKFEKMRIMSLYASRLPLFRTVLIAACFDPVHDCNVKELHHHWWLNLFKMLIRFILSQCYFRFECLIESRFNQWQRITIIWR